MLAAREDLVNQIGEIAKKNGTTLFALTNMALENLVDLDMLEAQFGEAVNAHKILKTAREAGFVLAPESLLYDTAERIYCTDEKWACKRWTEAGEWYGNYHRTKKPETRLNDVVNDFSLFFWNVREFNIIQKNGNMLLQCVVPRLPENYSLLFGMFLRGALSSLGYECVEENFVKGIFSLTFKPRC